MGTTPELIQQSFAAQAEQARTELLRLVWWQRVWLIVLVALLTVGTWLCWSVRGWWPFTVSMLLTLAWAINYLRLSGRTHALMKRLEKARARASVRVIAEGNSVRFDPPLVLEPGETVVLPMAVELPLPPPPDEVH